MAHSSDHRARRALVMAALPLVLLAPAAATQAPAERPRPVQCANPADRLVWENRLLHLTLDHADGGGRRLPVALRQLILQDLSTRLRGPLMPAGGSMAASRTAPAFPAADTLYSPRLLLSSVRFTLFGDGSVAGVTVDTLTGGELGSGSGDALFEGHAADAIERAAAEGAIGPISSRGKADSALLVLTVADSPFYTSDTTSAEWPLFYMAVPAGRAPGPLGRPQIHYPEMARAQGFQANVLMQFVVDETGRPIASTIEPLRRLSDVPDNLEVVYREFIAAVRAGIEQVRYLPAERLGCRVRQLVQQPFVFGLR